MGAKTLFLGFDGGDPAFIDRMIADGELPTFKALRDRSDVHNIENNPGMGAAHFWNSASIGAGPADHGHYFYLQFDPKTYDIAPVHERGLPDITPFWHSLDDQGYKIAIIDWHRMLSKPLKNGIIVDNWLVHDPLVETAWYPPSLAEEGARFFKGDPIGGGYEFIAPETADEINDFLKHFFNRTTVKTSFCVDQLEREDWDLFVACFSEAHDTGHHLFHLDDENHDQYDAALAAQVREPLRETYRHLDREMARIVAAAGPDAKVFTFGGPGMETLIGANTVFEEMLRRIDLGVEAPKSTAEVAKQQYHSIIPVRLRRRFAPLARALRRNLANSEYKRRRFFQVPHNDNSGGVRINLKGRERHGIVNPGAEYDAVIDKLEEELSSFINTDTGKPLVKFIVRMRKDYEGPHADVLPDLFVEWDRTDTDHDFKKITSAKYGDIEKPPAKRSGDHNPTGFLWAPPGASDKALALPEDIVAPVMNVVTAAK